MKIFYKYNSKKLYYIYCTTFKIDGKKNEEIF